MESKECYLCGYSRIVEVAHVIPRRLYSGIFEKPKYMKTVYLCPNHHKLYDYNKLDPDEMAKMVPMIKQELAYLQRFTENFDKYYELKYWDEKEREKIKRINKRHIVNYLVRIKPWLVQP